MSISISSINYCPVKSISFQTIKSCEIRKNIGIVGVGRVELEGIDLCRPCRHLCEVLNQNNIIKEFLRRGGLRCQILSSSSIEVGNKIRVFN